MRTECERPLVQALGAAHRTAASHLRTAGEPGEAADRWLLSAVFRHLAAWTADSAGGQRLLPFVAPASESTEAALVPVRAALDTRLAAGEPAADVLCTVFEWLVDWRSGAAPAGRCSPADDAAHSRRRRAGAYFTPPPVVDFLVESALLPLAACDAGSTERRRLSVLDPACGSGRFLLAAARCLSAAWRVPIAAVLASIYGVDASSLAVQVCRAVLWLAAHGEVPVEMLEQSIQWGDAIAGPIAGPDAPSIHAEIRSEAAAPLLDWQAAFSRAMRHGGFDVVLGNPPFANAIEQPTGRTRWQRALYRQRYPGIATGAYDLSALFVARAIELLRPGGAYGLVCPRAIASATGSAALRAYLADVAPPEVIWCPNTSTIFRGAKVFVSIIVGRRAGPPKLVRVSTAPEPKATAFRPVPWPATPAFERWWELVMADPAIGVQPRRAWPALSEVAELWAGTSTAVAYEIAGGIVDDPAGCGLRFITTGAIDRYECRWGRARQRYLGRDYQYPRWPAGLGSSAAARSYARQARPKLLVGGLSRVAEAWLDETGEAAGAVSTVIVVPKVNDRWTRLALLAVLNSPVFSYCYLTRYGARSLAGDNCPIGKRELGTIPVPFAPAGAAHGEAGTSSTQKNWMIASDGAAEGLWSDIVELADRIIGCDDAATRAGLDEALRALVSAAYGLTPEEHRAVDAWWQKRLQRPTR